MRYLGKPSVGIIRTEREIIKQALQISSSKFVRYDQRGQVFREVPSSLAYELVQENPSVTLSEAELRSLSIHSFSCGGTFINSGLPWDSDLTKCIFLEKKKHGFKYLQILYDMIPVIMPEYSVPGISPGFHRFLLDISYAADVVYGISDHSIMDFDNYLTSLNLRKPDLRRIVLGSDLVHDTQVVPKVYIPGCFCKVPIDQIDSFVLYVSSIEPRKNHVLAFSVWRKLYAEMGVNTPILVFVGKVQWRSQDFVDIIKDSHVYRAGKILILENLTDSEICYLYANCIFTIYPSYYEGWGLPVAEAFRFRKTCISSNAASLPEVVGNSGILLDPHDFTGWFSNISMLLRFPDKRGEYEANIQKRNDLLDWSEAVCRFLQTV